MTRALIHIGMPKTGTSAIQSWLRVNAAALRGRGVYFDGFGDRLKSPVQHELGFALLAAAAAGKPVPHPDVRRRTGTTTPEGQQAVTAAFAKKFGQSTADAGDSLYVISSEWLSAWLDSAKAIGQFHAEMRRHFSEIVYVVYLRDQADWALSAYGQRIRHGSPVTLEQHLQQTGTRDYNHLCDLWSAGTESALSVRLMEQDFLRNGDLIADFAALIGVDPTGLARPTRANRGLSARTLAFWRRMNALGARRGLSRPVQVLRAAHCNSPLARMGRALTLTSAQRRRIAEANAASNTHLLARWFPDRPVLFQHAHRALTQPPAASAAMNS
jgi:hypothetical protein